MTQKMATIILVLLSFIVLAHMTLNTISLVIVRSSIDGINEQLLINREAIKSNLDVLQKRTPLFEQINKDMDILTKRINNLDSKINATTRPTSP